MAQHLRDAVEWPRKLWTPKSNLEPPNFTEKSILIAVMGMTGAGKTTFISKITGLDMEIGHGLKSCTKEIQIATIRIDGHEVHLIDTPGFDDTELKDSDILIRIAGYLSSNIHLSGILYLHPITARRVGGAATRNLEMFRNLVGEENMGNVKLVTTMWNDITPQKGEAYLDELMRDFWKVMITAQAQVYRCDDAAKDGEHIIRSILRTSPVTLRFQREIQDGLRLEETAAGRVVMDQLNELRERHERDIKELREQLADATMHRDMVATIRKEYEEKLLKQEEAAEQARKLQEADIEMLRKEVEELKKGGGCIIL
ncbi:hypothetical protein FOVG_19158 [Fusarium oxysporum f. sp. pisi HDV247]|uniref:GTP-binding protein A n=2 Tax=Fusarium oxysporum TaxID=5507 RepID=A0A8J5NYF2_FUSOX|nr:hypothetical protein FOVG_19158 [Fusarium oxysporum f. sp. pisi HDV247]KAG7408467.1 GTP-binding protein A [Fusarium oxysporum f. sp. rapae]